jgi:putative FmdB family regulatory protein
MPTYEYKCKKGHVFEVVQRMADDSLTECEVCGAPVQKVLHPIAIHFKGSGFHNTDYGTRRRNREAKEASAAEGKSESSTSSSESKSDSKSDSKSESKSKSEPKTSASSSSKSD